MNRQLFVFLALALIGAAAPPAALIAGAVRDQLGAPIADAQVEAFPSLDGSRPTRTADDGTFVLRANGALNVRITCAFCAPQIARVDSDGTVVAIVRRYQGLMSDGPTSRDEASLPYSRVESDLSLTPFVMLNDSSNALPGPQLSDRGASPDGGLLVDNGIPNYDTVANISPFYSIPQHYETTASSLGLADAYQYGDVANGGTFITSPGSDGNNGLAVFGSDSAIRASAASGPVIGSAGYSSDSAGQQARADMNTSFAAPLTTTRFSLLDSRGENTFRDADTLASAFSGARVDVDRSGPVAIDASLTIDRGSYSLYTQYEPISAAWSDVDARVDIHSNATVAPFALLSFRSSSGDSGSANLPDFSGATTLGQVQALGGVRFHEATIDGTVAFAIDDATYSGGYAGRSQPASALARDSIAKLDYHPTARWRLIASDGTSFRLPTFLELNSYTAGRGVMLDQDNTLEGTLEYSDAGRLRVGLTALSRNTTGFEQGTIASAGASVGWQIAPKISARAWSMRVTPNETISLPVAYFGAMPRPATVGSGWITYDNDGALRLDAIWRQDLIDWYENPHFDASASGPLSNRLRWYVSTEKRDFARHTDLGVRW